MDSKDETRRSFLLRLARTVPFVAPAMASYAVPGAALQKGGKGGGPGPPGGGISPVGGALQANVRYGQPSGGVAPWSEGPPGVAPPWAVPPGGITGGWGGRDPGKAGDPGGRQ